MVTKFNTLPQFYGFQPIDEVIRGGGQALLVLENASGFNPWKFTFFISKER